MKIKYYIIDEFGEIRRLQIDSLRTDHGYIKHDDDTVTIKSLEYGTINTFPRSFDAAKSKLRHMLEDQIGELDVLKESDVHDGHYI